MSAARRALAELWDVSPMPRAGTVRHGGAKACPARWALFLAATNARCGWTKFNQVGVSVAWKHVRANGYTTVAGPARMRNKTTWRQPEIAADSPLPPLFILRSPCPSNEQRVSSPIEGREGPSKLIGDHGQTGEKQACVSCSAQPRSRRKKTLQG